MPEQPDPSRLAEAPPTTTPSAADTPRAADSTPLVPDTRAPGPSDSPTTVNPDRHPAGTALPPDLPAQVGPYRVEEEIARGGFGVVLRAADPEFNRTLAIKVLLARHQDSDDLERRFWAEAQVTAQLQHPGIAPVHAQGRLPDGRPFFAMKLVKGRTLSVLLKERQDPAYDLPHFLSIFEQICQTLAYAHSRRIIHRDLKPGNVMVGAFSEVQVMDWGLAKLLRPADDGPEPSERTAPEEITTIRPPRADAPGLSTQAGGMLGTPAFMAPEQARGEVDQLDERCDVFGLGAILCVILTGESPFRGETVAAIHRQAAAGDLAGAFGRLDRCGADAELVRLARDCLAPAKDDRPRHAGAVAEAVAAYQAAVRERLRQAEVGRAEAQVMAREERKRRKWVLALAAAGMLILTLIGGGAWWLDRQRVARETEQARLRDEATQAVRRAIGETRSLQERAEARPHDLGLYREAVAAARRADELARQGPVGQELRRQTQTLLAEMQGALKDAHKDRRLLDTCLEISGPRETPAYRRDPSGRVAELARPDADEQFAAAFRASGLDVDRMTSNEVVARLQRRPKAVQQEIAAALDEWAFQRRRKGRPQADSRRLVELARALDPDPDRNQVRAILARGRLGNERRRGLLTQAFFPLTALTGQVPGADRNRLRELARGTDAGREPVLSLALLARALREAGDDAEAERLLRAGLRPRPGEVVLNYALGKLLEEQRPTRWPEAVEVYKAARAVRPELGLSLAWALGFSDRAAEGLELLRWLAEREPDNLVLRHELTLTLAMHGRLEEAAVAAEEWARLDPGDGSPYFILGMGLIWQDRLDEAITAFRKSIARDDKLADAHGKLGFCLAERSQTDEAIRSYLKAIDLNPADAAVHNNLGVALAEKDRFQEAAAAFSRAVKHDPRNAKYHNNLGNALLDLDQDRAAEAVAAYAEAARLAPREAEYHYNLGVARFRLDRLDEAIAAFKQATLLDPERADAHNNLGLALYQKGRTDEAITEYRQAIAIGRKAAQQEPELAFAHFNLGLALVAKGRTDEAIAEFRNGLAIRPGDATAHFYLGNALQERNGYAAAASHFATAFAGLPELADDPRQPHRYNAACCAALAAAGKGEGADKLDDKERADLRRQALDWLRADLAAWNKIVEKGPPQLRPVVQKTLAHWRKDADLASVREPRTLAKLPPNEREAWQKLWADVRDLLRRAGKQ